MLSSSCFLASSSFSSLPFSVSFFKASCSFLSSSIFSSVSSTFCSNSNCLNSSSSLSNSFSKSVFSSSNLSSKSFNFSLSAFSIISSISCKSFLVSSSSTLFINSCSCFCFFSIEEFNFSLFLRLSLFFCWVSLICFSNCFCFLRISLAFCLSSQVIFFFSKMDLFSSAISFLISLASDIDLLSPLFVFSFSASFFKINSSFVVSLYEKRVLFVLFDPFTPSLSQTSK